MGYPVIDINKVFELLSYDVKAPLLFNSGLFLLLFLGFMFVYGFVVNRVPLRIAYVTIFSFYFYYKSSGWYFLLMLAVTTIAHYLSMAIYVSRIPRKRKALLITALFIFIGCLVVFKYTNFIIDIINNFTKTPLKPIQIFLPLGISFYTFELISYAVDVYQRKFKPVKKLSHFYFYISFFPHLVAGPIVRPKELVPQITRKLIISNQFIGRGIFFILSGLIKKAVISDYIGVNFVDRIFDNPLLYSGVENLLGIYGYTLQIYCDFSGYSDMAVGIALLMGFQLPMNFDAPYRSTNITEFWRKWHISLSSWLRDYLYIPLGGNKSGVVKQYVNLMITMLLGGLWHGASLKFVVWGGMHGLALVFDKLKSKLTFFASNKKPSVYRLLIGWFFTFHLVAFCWIFFRASNFSDAIAVINQIIWHFNPRIFVSVITGYPQVFGLVAFGYAIHFIPKAFEEKLSSTISQVPLPVQAVLLAVVIWVVYQTKSASVQPFIYFQF